MALRPNYRERERMRQARQRRLRRFEVAVRNHEMKGSLHPDDWRDIEIEFEAAKLALVNWIKQLQMEKTNG